MKRNDSIRCSFIIIVLVMKCLRIVAHSFKKKDVFAVFNFSRRYWGMGTELPEEVELKIF